MCCQEQVKSCLCRSDRPAREPNNCRYQRGSVRRGWTSRCTKWLRKRNVPGAAAQANPQYNCLSILSKKTKNRFRTQNGIRKDPAGSFLVYSLFFFPSLTLPGPFPGFYLCAFLQSCLPQNLAAIISIISIFPFPLENKQHYIACLKQPRLVRSSVSILSVALFCT